MWDTNPPRQVNAADVVRGVKRSCNPNTPYGGQPDFSDILVGYKAFCDGFAKVSSTSASAMAAYINEQSDSGVQPDPSNPLTVDFTLTKAASYFTGVLGLPPFNPAPVEVLQAVPASNNVWQYVMSDGPYKIQSYSPNKTIVFVRNPHVEAVRRPDPARLRRPDLGLRDRQPAGHLPADPDQLAAGRHAVGCLRAPTIHPRPHCQQGSPLPAPIGVGEQSLPGFQHGVAQQQQGPGKCDRPPGHLLCHRPEPAGPGRRWSLHRRAADPRHGSWHRRCGPGRLAGLLPLRCQQGQADAGVGRIPTSAPEVHLPAEHRRPEGLPDPAVPARPGRDHPDRTGLSLGDVLREVHEPGHPGQAGRSGTSPMSGGVPTGSPTGRRPGSLRSSTGATCRRTPRTTGFSTLRR